MRNKLRYILESASFQLFFKYVELSKFDVASDAFATSKDLLTKHEKEVSEYLASHYDKFFDMYERLLTSPSYVARRQSLKVSQVVASTLPSELFPSRAAKFAGHEALHFRNPESESHHDFTKEESQYLELRDLASHFSCFIPALHDSYDLQLHLFSALGLQKGRTSEKRLSQLQGLVQEERAFKATGNQWEVSKVSTPKIRCLRKLNLLRFADYS
ncbi:Calcium-binding protein 39-like-like protein [Drosera capensis]